MYYLNDIYLVAEIDPLPCAANLPYTNKYCQIFSNADKVREENIFHLRLEIFILVSEAGTPIQDTETV